MSYKMSLKNKICYHTANERKKYKKEVREIVSFWATHYAHEVILAFNQHRHPFLETERLLFHFSIRGNRFFAESRGNALANASTFSHTNINKIDNGSARFALLHKTFELVLLIGNKIR